MIMTGALTVGGAASIASSIFGHNSAKKEAEAQKAAYRAQANAYLRMGSIYSSAARAQAGVGSIIMGTAKHAITAGKANAKQERLMASRIQAIEDIELQRINKERRQKIGAGRAAFASNGVLVDSGAAALWEQDEAADAAIEKLMLMQAAEDQAWGHLNNAKNRLVEGYSQAAGIYANAGGAYSNAANTASQAASSAIQAMGALQGAANVQGPSAWGTGMSVIGSLANTVGRIYEHNVTPTARESSNTLKAAARV